MQSLPKLWSPGITECTAVLVQPRAVAAEKVAEELAELFGCEVGGTVDLITGEDSRVSSHTKLLVVTPRIFHPEMVGLPRWLV